MFKKFLAAIFAITVVFSVGMFAKNTRASYPVSQNERLVIGALKSVQQAQMSYHNGVGAGNFGAFFQLRQANLIDPVLASLQKYGYDFAVTVIGGAPNGSPLYNVVAVPGRYRKTGIRSFYIDENCEIRGGDKNGASANINDPIIETCTPSMRVENEREIIRMLRTIHSAEMTYLSTTGNGNFGLISHLVNAGLVPQSFDFQVYRGYRKQMTVWARTSMFPSRFEIKTRPDLYGTTGVRSFYVDETGVIRGADRNGQYGDANDPPIEKEF
jgi:hypothetical protein